MLPLIRSVVAAPAELLGTRTMEVEVFWGNNWPAVCMELPLPVEPNDSLSGYLFKYATNSFTAVAGIDGFTTRMLAPLALTTTGSKSALVSNRGSLYMAGLVANGPAPVKRSVCPFGAERLTKTAPRFPLAPGLLATTKPTPNCLPSSSATMRASGSVVPPPAPKGTTTCTGPLGQESVCAGAAIGESEKTKARARIGRWGIMRSQESQGRGTKAPVCQHRMQPCNVWSAFGLLPFGGRSSGAGAGLQGRRSIIEVRHARTRPQGQAYGFRVVDSSGKTVEKATGFDLAGTDRDVLTCTTGKKGRYESKYSGRRRRRLRHCGLPGPGGTRPDALVTVRERHGTLRGRGAAGRPRGHRA